MPKNNSKERKAERKERIKLRSLTPEQRLLYAIFGKHEEESEQE